MRNKLLSVFLGTNPSDKDIYEAKGFLAVAGFLLWFFCFAIIAEQGMPFSWAVLLLAVWVRIIKALETNFEKASELERGGG